MKPGDCRAAFLLLALLGGCGDRAPAPATAPDGCTALALESPPAPRSVVFVLSDTLRRDRLGAYGGPARTPAFDRLAGEGVLFTQVATQAPWTKPSIATLFTGLYPSQHGVVSHPALRERGAGTLTSDVLAAERVTLAEALAGAGWRTAGFVSNPWLRAELGFAQGFAVWDDSLAANDAPGELVNRAGLDWLRALPEDGRPFFLYLHYMDAHDPAEGVSDAALAARRDAIEADRRPLSASVRREIARRALDAEGRPLVARGLPPNLALIELVYDTGVEAFDRALAALLEGLERIPVARDAAIVVTSDHGEALYTRGWSGHGHGLFEDEIGVPLVMRWPGIAPGRVDCPAGLVDLRSTLCALLAVECGGRDQGRSLLGPRATSVVVSEGVIARPRHRAARGPRYTLLYEPDGRVPGAEPPRGVFSLYDRRDAERRDLLTAADAPPDLDRVLARLRPALESGIAALDLAADEEAPLDEETRRRLEALGYVGEEAP